MANAYPAEVNRTVNHKTTIGGVVRWRPGVITALPATLNVTAAVRTSGTVTLTVNNSLAAGRWVQVDLVNATYDGLFLITSANGTSITYSQAGADAGTTTGTVRDVSTATIRVGHHGETYTAVIRRTGADVPWNNTAQARTDLNKWRPG